MIRKYLLLTACLPAAGSAATLLPDSLLCEFQQPLHTVVDEGWNTRRASEILQAARERIVFHDTAGRQAFAQLQQWEKTAATAGRRPVDEATAANIEYARISSHNAGEQAARYRQITDTCSASGTMRLSVAVLEVDAAHQVVKVQARGRPRPDWVLKDHLAE